MLPMKSMKNMNIYIATLYEQLKKYSRYLYLSLNAIQCAILVINIYKQEIMCQNKAVTNSNDINNSKVKVFMSSNRLHLHAMLQ